MHPNALDTPTHHPLTNHRTLYVLAYIQDRSSSSPGFSSSAPYHLMRSRNTNPPSPLLMLLLLKRRGRTAITRIALTMAMDTLPNK